MLPRILGDDEGETLDLSPVLDRLKELARSVPGFDIKERWVIGNFAFQKLAIVRDVRDLGDAMARHAIVAGIAGDDDARGEARGDRTSGDAAEIDRTPPDQEFLILDADSSQQLAIRAVLKGQNGVISGPPGTGKSQTIANLIAELVSRGKTVLFVAEKRAALDVVKARLAHAGLAHVCLDCHGAETSRRMVAEQLQESCNLIRQASQPNAAQTHERFADRRDKLNRHVAAMHTPRLSAGLSVYKLYGRLLRLPDDARTDARMDRASVERIRSTDVQEACDLLREAGAHAEIVVGTSPSPWMGAAFGSAEPVRTAIETARSLATERWDTCERAFAALASESSGKRPVTIAEVRRVADVLERIRTFLTSCREEIFTRPLTELAATLEPAKRPVARIWATLASSRFRAAVKDVRGLGVASRLSSRDCLGTVTAAMSLMAEWRTATSSERPRWSTACDAALAAWQDVSKDLEALVKRFPNRRLEEIEVSSIAPWLRGLAADAVTPARIQRIEEIDKTLTASGFAPVVDDIRARKPPSALWPDILRFAWLSSAIQEVQLADPAVASFQGRHHDEIAREFRALDKERLALAVQRVRRAHAEAAIAACNAHPPQDALVRHEAGKRSKHLPLRRLFAEASDVLLALRPCWMASPLSVSQLIPGDRPYFDVVVFDEASQVLPEDAVTSLLRGRQAVVAGDKKQLPPTTFFAATDDDSDVDEGSATAGFESILDVMSAFLEPAWSLDWHYRSRDEALIAYSNHRIYGGRLVTFPGPGIRRAVSHVLVSQPPSQGGQEESVSAEVLRVVDLVMAHAGEHPGDTLGVITMGIQHAKRIEAELDRVRQTAPELDEFFSTSRSERFFIKNLERVQGDERDAIILSVGYGKNEAGRLLYRFGPLLQQGGERRLNVAITRARRRMTLVSAFSHVDVDPDYPKDGVRHLRNYLEYAASGGRSLGLSSVGDVPLNDFEQSVFDELTRRGLTLVGQVGSSNYRIDLAALHPDTPGRFVLAIECDGASYHSAPSARDRDRLRQQQLEDIGWRFCRIWSTDWFLRREDEVRRVLAAFEKARREADTEDARGEGPTRPHDENGHDSAGSPAAGAAEIRRAPRPRIVHSDSITDYALADIVAVIRWIMSDGKLRTDEELLHETVAALGFERRGPRIVQRITAAIQAAKQVGA